MGNQSRVPMTVTRSLSVHTAKVVCMLLSLVLLHGCARSVMPAPNLYTSAGRSLFEELVPELETNQVDVLYVTDRLPEKDEAGNLTYGFERSPSVAYGSAIVELGHDLSWEELVTYSTTKSESGSRPRLNVVSISELGRFPATPYLFRIVDNTDIPLDPAVVAEREQTMAAAGSELTRRLRRTRRKEVYVWVHGVANTFDDAVQTAAEGWHFMGREGALIAYTWPAGKGGFFNYAYDRESGEFTVFHLKQFLRFLASIPELEKIHIISHSRGTDVAMTALRELWIETRAAGRNAREHLKIGNVVLIAPDLDFEVSMQRLVAEAVGAAFERLSIYTSKDDTAINAAKTLFQSVLRVGALEQQELSDQQRQTLNQVTNMDIITYHGRIGGRFGHGYFLTNPAVSSDIISVLRYGRLPGPENGRPLKQVGANFWLIDDDYLQ